LGTTLQALIVGKDLQGWEKGPSASFLGKMAVL
jgi:hypothetical protein